jgi:hypothetical protein
LIQSGLLPNTLATIDQLDDPEVKEAIGGVILLSNTVEMKITPWIAQMEIHVDAGQSELQIIHMYMGLALKDNILVDVTEDYRKILCLRTKQAS